MLAPAGYARSDGAERIPISGLSGSLQNPCFSPDSRQIALTLWPERYNDGQASVHVADLESGEVQARVSPEGTAVNLPGSCWNPATNLILFSLERDAPDWPYAANPDGTGLRRLVSLRGRIAIEPSFSPDGERIVFEVSKYDADGNGSIYVANVDGTGVRRLTRGHDDRQPNWSPRGNRIVFQRRKGEVWDVWTVRPSGRGLRMLHEDAAHLRDRHRVGARRRPPGVLDDAYESQVAALAVKSASGRSDQTPHAGKAVVRRGSELVAGRRDDRLRGPRRRPRRLARHAAVDDCRTRAVTAVGRGSIALAVICASTMHAGAPPARAAIPDGNVLVNSGGETGPAATDGSSNICPQGWTCHPMFPQTTLVRYGTTTFPSAAESARIGGRNNFFAGGPNNTLSGAEQIFGFETEPEFAAGAVQATFGGCLGGFQAQDDLARVLLTFMTAEDPDGVSPSHTVSPNGPTAAERGNKTTLLPVSQTVQVPPTTRSIRFTVSFQRTGVGYNDGYADNLSLVFGRRQPGSARPVLLGAGGGRWPGHRTWTRARTGPRPGRRWQAARAAEHQLRCRRQGGQGTRRVTCNSTQVSRCKGTLSVTLVRASASASAAQARNGPLLGSLPLKARTIKVPLRRSDARKIRRGLQAHLFEAAAAGAPTTKVSVVKFRQTEVIRLKRPR